MRGRDGGGASLFEHESTGKIIYLQKGNLDRFHARCFLVSVGIVDYEIGTILAKNTVAEDGD